MTILHNPFSLEGKTILVTGASSGIGRSVAEVCSKMGATIIACGRNESRLRDTVGMLAGKDHCSYLCDLSNEDSLAALVDSVSSIDGVVSAAGISHVAPFLFSKSDTFKNVFEQDFFMHAELLRMLVKKKKLTTNASVIFIVAINGTTTFFPGSCVYGSAKAALQSFVRYAAIELGSKKIRVNGVCPGFIDTPMAKVDAVSDEQINLCIEQTPLKRFGMPSDVANGVVYLLSDAASWVTGQSLIIDGGYSAR